MKKAITILAVLIVLVSAVFADETHTLKIKATQAVIPPAFQMYVQSVTQTGATAAGTDIMTNSSSVGYGVGRTEAEPNATYSLTTTEAATFSFETANTVKVAVKLGNDAKTAQNYSLSFNGGIFNVSKNGLGKYADPSGATDPVIDEETGEQAVDGEGNPITTPHMLDYTVAPASKTTSAGTNSNAANGFVTTGSSAVTVASTASTATVDFNGKTCTAGHEIAVCDFAYDAHTDVDPGTYFANVTLTITTSI